MQVPEAFRFETSQAGIGTSTSWFPAPGSAI